MTAQAEHEHPQYVTMADLEALEGRLINRIAELEKHVNSKLDNVVTHWQILVVALTIIGVNLTVVGISAAALFFALNNLTALIAALPRSGQ